MGQRVRSPGARPLIRFESTATSRLSVPNPVDCLDRNPTVAEFVVVGRADLLLLTTQSRYSEIGPASVRCLFQFVLVASAGGQLPVGRVHILPAVLHVAG